MRPWACLRAPLAWPFLLIVLFSSYIGGVLATGLAGGFERVLFYYVYRGSVLTWGKNQARIMPKAAGVDCTIGTHTQGGCNFVEFVQRYFSPIFRGRRLLLPTMFANQYLLCSLNGKPLDPGQVTQSGISLERPDPIKAANLVNKDRSHTTFIGLRRLMPGCTDYGSCINLTKKLYKESE